jgi:hypothetical protein
MPGLRASALRAKRQPGTPRVSPVTTPRHAAERFYCAQLFLAVLLALYCLFVFSSFLSI